MKGDFVTDTALICTIGPCVHMSRKGDVTCPGAPDGQGAPKLCHLEGHAILALMKGKDTTSLHFILLVRNTFLL